MWCSYHKTTIHSGANYCARPTNRSNRNAHFAQVRPVSVPGICSSWDLPVRDESDENPYIPFSAREVQPAAKPTEAQVEEEMGAWLFESAPTVAMEGWSARPCPFTPRAEPAVMFGGLLAEEKPNLCYMFGMADGEQSAEKAIMASSLATLPLRTATTATSSRLWWTAKRQATTSTTQPSVTSNTVCRTVCISLRSPRFSLSGELCWTIQ